MGVRPLAARGKDVPGGRPRPPAASRAPHAARPGGGVPYLYTPPRWLLIWIFLTLCLQSAAGRASKRKNVLLLIADDMRPQLDIYKDLDTGIVPLPRMYTPNINELASKSLVLGRAYCQVAICSPSRSSFLTGRRPDTTRIYDSQSYFRDVGGDFTTIPQYFKDNGYKSIGMGKVFHPGRRASANDDPVSWSNNEYPYYHPESEVYWRMNGKKRSYMGVGSNFAYNLKDAETTQHAVETLIKLKPQVDAGENFFMAVGFTLPHLPFVVPSRYLDYYPLGEIEEPLNSDPPEDMPNVAWFTSSELKGYDDIKQLAWTGAEKTRLPNTTTVNLRRHYYAAVTYVDYLIGQVLKTLDDLQMSDDTIVVFLSDHGYQLGEHGLWTKNTNFEIALQVPFMIHVPGLTRTMEISTKIVELVDLFPTLVELTGLPKLDMCSKNATITSTTKVCREGSSFVRLFHDPKDSMGKAAAFSQIYRSPYQAMGYTVRTSRYRYTEWVRFNRDSKEALWDQPLLGEELYDHMTDPQENVNLASDVTMTVRILKQDLKSLLREGYRSKRALPLADWSIHDTSASPGTFCSRAYLCLYLVVLSLLQTLSILL